MNEGIHDLLVIGGGINGAGIARDAAGQGLSVLLAEMGDLGGGTSSNSTKLIHGGLRYLEQGGLSLVRQALAEREVQMRLAPHLVWPMRFVLPHEASLRPAWMIRLGLFVYDHAGGRKVLPASRRIDLTTAPEGRPLQERFKEGFEYADCWCDDARLVVANCLDAAARGAVILTRTEVTGASRAGTLWQATLWDGRQRQTVLARAMVNAAGPWAGAVQTRLGGSAGKARLKLVKGSHIVVDRVHDGGQAYIFQHTDRRVIFLLPYQQRFSLIGTTDVPYEGDPADAVIEETEIEYLLAAVGRVLRRPVERSAVRWSYAGVRPLYDDGKVDASAVSREYVFDLDAPAGQAPLLMIYGGKLTTYRRLAEHALRKLLPAIGRKPRSWTAGAPLPGGDVPQGDFSAFAAALASQCSFLPPPLARRYARLYGTRTKLLLADVQALADLGACLGGDLYEREVSFLRATEWARTAADILWRRTKLGLELPPDAVARVEEFLAQKQ